MARYVTTKPTDWSADEAFSWMADLRHLADWDPSISASEQVAGAGPGVGSEYDVTVTVAGSKQVMRYEIVEFEPDRRRMLATSETAVLTSYDRIRVDSDERGEVSVTYDADLVLKGPAKVGDPLLGVGIDRVGDKAAAGLEAVLARPTPPT